MQPTRVRWRLSAAIRTFGSNEGKLAGPSRGTISMAIEEEHLYILQNIEFVVADFYRHNVAVSSVERSWTS